MREGPIHVRSRSRVLLPARPHRSILDIASTDSRIHRGLADDQPGTPVRLSLDCSGRIYHSLNGYNSPLLLWTLATGGAVKELDRECS